MPVNRIVCTSYVSSIYVGPVKQAKIKINNKKEALKVDRKIVNRVAE